MTLDQAIEARKHPMAVEIGRSIPGYEDCYGVILKWSEPNEFNPSLTSERQETFFSFEKFTSFVAKMEAKK